MDPLDPPANFLPSHLVLRVTPRPFSLAPMGSIQDNGTALMSPYLTPPASLPGMAPSPLVQLGGLPYGQRAALSAAITIWGVPCVSCVPGGITLRPPAPHDITFMGP